MDIASAINEIQNWMDIEGVEGIAEGISDGIPCITVFVSLKDLAQQYIPSSYKGIRVVLEETDPFHSLD